jgi:hypothetical protein
MAFFLFMPSSHSLARLSALSRALCIGAALASTLGYAPAASGQVALTLEAGDLGFLNYTGAAISLTTGQHYLQLYSDTLAHEKLRSPSASVFPVELSAGESRIPGATDTGGGLHGQTFGPGLSLGRSFLHLLPDGTVRTGEVISSLQGPAFTVPAAAGALGLGSLGAGLVPFVTSTGEVRSFTYADGSTNAAWGTLPSAVMSEGVGGVDSFLRPGGVAGNSGDYALAVVTHLGRLRFYDLTTGALLGTDYYTLNTEYSGYSDVAYDPEAHKLYTVFSIPGSGLGGAERYDFTGYAGTLAAAPIPEPAGAAMLLGVASLLLASLRRRRHRLPPATR